MFWIMPGVSLLLFPIQGLRLEGNTNYFYKKFTKEYKISTPKLLHYGSDTIKKYYSAWQK